MSWPKAFDSWTPEQKDAWREKIAEYRCKYEAANRKKIAERQRKRYKANREKIAEYQRKYRAANAEKLAERQRQRYEANREKMVKRSRKYQAANREKLAEYRRNWKAATRQQAAADQFFVMAGAAQQISETISNHNKTT